MKINYPILRKALGFAFLPTLLVIIVAMFATLSFTSVFELLLSDSWWAILLRIVLLVIEVGIVYFMYDYYLTQEKTKKAIGDAIQQDSDWESTSGGQRIGYIGTWNDSYRDSYATKRINKDLYLVKRTQNS